MKIWRLWVQSRLGAIFYFAPLCQCWQRIIEKLEYLISPSPNNLLKINLLCKPYKDIDKSLITGAMESDSKDSLVTVTLTMLDFCHLNVEKSFYHWQVSIFTSIDLNFFPLTLQLFK